MLRPSPGSPGNTTRGTKAPAQAGPTRQRQLIAVAAAADAEPPNAARLAQRIVDGFVDESKHLPSGPVDADVYGLAMHHTRLLELAPQRTLEAQLRGLVAFAPVSHASLWTNGAAGRFSCEAAAGSSGTTRSVRRAAADVLGGVDSRRTGSRALVHALPVSVRGTVHAALVYRAVPGQRDSAARYAAETADALSYVLDRRMLVEGIEARDRLLRSLERRSARQRYELHDGTMQRLSTLIAELSHLKRQTGLLSDRLAENQDLAVIADRELREVVQVASPTAAPSSLESTIKRELRTLTARTGIVGAFETTGSETTAGAEQRRVASRVVGEAIANVRQHSEAARVEVRVVYDVASLTLTITDDGRGFSPAVARDAERFGRFGLTAMRDRVRLAGGEFEIHSRAGGPTVVTAVIPRGADETA